MTPRPAQHGYAMVDVLMGLVLFGLVILAVYRVLIPVFALVRNADDQLAAQQDVRLTLDRMARELHETTLAQGRMRIYAPSAGCAGAYDGCIGFVTARAGDCTGPFQLINGAPDWQATIYIWRDTAAHELRRRCDTSTTFPVSHWPPPRLEPFAVVGTRIVTAEFNLAPGGDAQPASIRILLQEQTSSAAGRTDASQRDVSSRTWFAPENR